MENFTAQKHREKGYIYYHGLRTAKLALNLRKELYPDESEYDELIYIGCLFHDMSKGNEPHDLNGSVAVRDILGDICTEPELDYISRVIKLHNKRKVTAEGIDKFIKIVQDADLLDHMGVQEIWLNFNYYARENKSIHDSLSFYESDEWNKYVENGLEVLNFEESKLFFKDKLAFVNEFIKRMKYEHEGLCPEVLIESGIKGSKIVFRG